MGEVWAARDTRAMGTRIVALKMTKQEGQEAAKVLFDEARIASLIEHPNVCKVYELGRAEGVQYMVMDFCDGASLFELLQAQPNKAIAIPLAVKIVAEVAAGLHAAHELVDEGGNLLHVVHRDVSPQNVLISSTGVVTISDFGVAKARGQMHQATVTGEVKGKLSYMAPEQVRSKDIDHRADVFALGCVLYMATLGQRPFSGGDAVALMYKILEANVELPSSHDAEFPRSLEALIMRALAREPNDRFQTAFEFQLALERWLREENRRVSAADIALLLEHTLGDRIQGRNARIRALASGLPDESPDEEPTQRDSEQAVSSEQDAAPTRTILESAFESAAPPRASKGFGRMFAATGLGALGLGLVVVIWGGPFGPGDGTPAVSTARNQQPPAPTVQVATLSTRVSPAEAEIRLNGAVIGRGAATIERPVGTEQALLSFSLDGYQTAERTVQWARDQSLEIALSPVAHEQTRVQPPIEKVERIKKPPVVRPSSGNTTVKETPPRDPPSNSPTIERKPRILDTNNPFAQGTN